MRDKNTTKTRKTIADKVGDKEVLSKPGMLKNLPPTTLNEAIKRNRPKPVATHTTNGGIKYYWDNTFMVFVEPGVRRPNIDVEELEENSTIESTTSTSQF